MPLTFFNSIEETTHFMVVGILIHWQIIKIFLFHYLIWFEFTRATPRFPREMIIVMRLDVELKFFFFLILILHFIKIHLILAVNYQLKTFKRAIEIENDDGIMIQCVRYVMQMRSWIRKKRVMNFIFQRQCRETLLSEKGIF